MNGKGSNICVLVAFGFLVALVMCWIQHVVEKSIQNSRDYTDSEINGLRADVALGFRATHADQEAGFVALRNDQADLREETHQIARAILEEVRETSALPPPRGPQGKVGFAEADPEQLV